MFFDNRELYDDKKKEKITYCDLTGKVMSVYS